mmetsp:Transcript_54778/g.108769  ORF Transcript_54778/g.108769 Transcript_54778/m.108769 type:complete len:210 (+) Transcript_54778:1455-2084(+)
MSSFAFNCALCEVSMSSFLTCMIACDGRWCGLCGRCSGASSVRFFLSMLVPPMLIPDPSDEAPVCGRPIGGSTLPFEPPNLLTAELDMAVAGGAPRASPKENSSDLFSQNSLANPKSMVMMPNWSGSAHTSPMRSTRSCRALSTTSLPTTSPSMSVVSVAMADMSSSTLSPSTACAFGLRSCRPKDPEKLSLSTNIGLRNSISPITSRR